jgi:hypothetical protein
MVARLNVDELRKLPDNWDGRASCAPSEQALNTAASFCAVPLGSGGLQVECHAGGIDLECEVDMLGNITSIYWTKRR